MTEADKLSATKLSATKLSATGGLFDPGTHLHLAVVEAADAAAARALVAAEHQFGHALGAGFVRVVAAEEPAPVPASLRTSRHVVVVVGADPAEVVLDEDVRRWLASLRYSQALSSAGVVDGRGRPPALVDVFDHPTVPGVEVTRFSTQSIVPEKALARTDEVRAAAGLGFLSANLVSDDDGVSLIEMTAAADNLFAGPDPLRDHGNLLWPAIFGRVGVTFNGEVPQPVGAVIVDDHNPALSTTTLRLPQGLVLADVRSRIDRLKAAAGIEHLEFELCADDDGRDLLSLVAAKKDPLATVARAQEFLDEHLDTSRQGMNLNLPVGVTADGRVKWHDFESHLVVAGASGSGKSVTLNVLLTSLVLQNPPAGATDADGEVLDGIEMVLVDPKIVELGSYRRLPHVTRFITCRAGPGSDEVEARMELLNVLKDLSEESDARMQLFGRLNDRYGASHGVRLLKLSHYHQLRRRADVDEQLAPLPAKFLIVEEAASLFQKTGDKEVDAVVSQCRAVYSELNTKARASGIFCTSVAQHPTDHVLPRQVGLQAGTKLCFRTADAMASAYVLGDGHGEAASLPGRGYGFILDGTSPEPQRFRGLFLAEDTPEDVAWWQAKLNSLVDQYGVGPAADESDPAIQFAHGGTGESDAHGGPGETDLFAADHEADHEADLGDDLGDGGSIDDLVAELWG
ncbi:MAG: hypothetical protein GY882_12925 [Actinomycetia bacterium]|nr:hypothetical protein [Actinomycetes bacterium]